MQYLQNMKEHVRIRGCTSLHRSANTNRRETDENGWKKHAYHLNMPIIKAKPTFRFLLLHEKLVLDIHRSDFLWCLCIDSACPLLFSILSKSKLCFATIDSIPRRNNRNFGYKYPKPVFHCLQYPKSSFFVF